MIHLPPPKKTHMHEVNNIALLESHLRSKTEVEQFFGHQVTKIKVTGYFPSMDPKVWVYSNDRDIEVQGDNLVSKLECCFNRIPSEMHEINSCDLGRIIGNFTIDFSKETPFIIR
jgi:hypothetical protein